MYIDAGTGSLMIQAATAGIFSFLVFFRQIAAWYGKLFRGKLETDGSAAH